MASRPFSPAVYCLGLVAFTAFSETMMRPQWCDLSRLHDVLSVGISSMASTVLTTETICDEL